MDATIEISKTDKLILRLAELQRSLYHEIPLIRSRIERVAIENNVEEGALTQEMLRFLYMISTGSEALSPPKVLDLAWHEFILFTRSYAAFCEENFGCFIHHQPDDDKAANSRQFRRSVQNYIIKFGEPHPDIWGAYASEEWQAAQCGSCNSN